MGYYFKYNNELRSLHFSTIPFGSRYIGSDNKAWYEAITYNIGVSTGYYLNTTNYFYGDNSQAVYAYQRNIINRLVFTQYVDNNQIFIRISQIQTFRALQENTTYRLEIYHMESQTGDVSNTPRCVISGHLTAESQVISLSGWTGQNGMFPQQYYKIILKLKNTREGDYQVQITGYRTDPIDLGGYRSCSFYSLWTTQKTTNLSGYQGYSFEDEGNGYYFYLYPGQGEPYWKGI